MHASAFATFQSRSGHRAGRQHHVLKFPASGIDEIAAAHVARPEIQLLPGSDEILLISADADVPSHQTAE